MQTEDLELPSTMEVRRRIENVNKKVYRNALKFGWLGLCRVSEIVGRVYDSDIHTKARGPTGDSVEVTEYRGNGESVPAILFTVRTAKRGGLSRTAAYPVDPSYEPWAGELCEYFKEFSPGQTVFDFTRQTLHAEARKAFAGFEYPIEEYYRMIDDTKIKVDSHYRSMGTHALRHLRAVDLLQFYGFSVQELSVIGGWTLGGMARASSSISRYAHLDWQSYFKKLLIRRF